MIRPRFNDGVRFFSEGPAPVKIGKEWGYIDVDGNFVIRPQFRMAYEFSGGVAAVALADQPFSRFGYIDKKGHFVIKPRFRKAKKFSDGLAAVKEEDKWGYITEDGNYVVEAVLQDVSDFSEGLAAVKQGGQWGYIDTDGYWVMKPRFDDAKSFHEGLAPVAQNRMWGFINKAGEVVIPYQYDEVEPFSEGLAVAKMGYLSGYIDKEGKWVIRSTSFAGLASFSEGLARVKEAEDIFNTKGKWGYVNKKGTFVIPPRFYWAWDFMGGMACVGMEKNSLRRAYIDHDGIFIWNPARWDREAFMRRLLWYVFVVVCLFAAFSIWRAYRTRQVTQNIFEKQAARHKGTIRQDPRNKKLTLEFVYQNIPFSLQHHDEKSPEYAEGLTLLKAPYPFDDYHHITFMPKYLAIHNYEQLSSQEKLKILEDPVLTEFFTIDTDEDPVYLNDLLEKEIKKKLFHLRLLTGRIMVSTVNKQFILRIETALRSDDELDETIELAAALYERMKEVDANWRK